MQCCFLQSQVILYFGIHAPYMGVSWGQAKYRQTPLTLAGQLSWHACPSLLQWFHAHGQVSRSKRRASLASGGGKTSTILRTRLDPVQGLYAPCEEETSSQLNLQLSSVHYCEFAA